MHPHLDGSHEGRQPDSAVPEERPFDLVGQSRHADQGASPRLARHLALRPEEVADKCVAQLWDVYNEGKCLRTFMGHSKSVHDINFDPSGADFLSAAFDRQMKLWDTETGALS